MKREKEKKEFLSESERETGGGTRSIGCTSAHTVFTPRPFIDGLKSIAASRGVFHFLVSFSALRLSFFFTRCWAPFFSFWNWSRPVPLWQLSPSTLSLAGLFLVVLFCYYCIFLFFSSLCIGVFLYKSPFFFLSVYVFCIFILTAKTNVVCLSCLYIANAHPVVVWERFQSGTTLRVSFVRGAIRITLGLVDIWRWGQ